VLDTAEPRERERVQPIFPTISMDRAWRLLAALFAIRRFWHADCLTRCVAPKRRHLPIEP